MVDDGSSDQTRAIAKAFLRPDQDVLLTHPTSQGKGCAIQSAQRVATGDLVIIQDGDLEYSPEDWGRILHPMLDGRADAVFGTRFLGSGERRVLYFWHSVGNQILTLLSNAVTNLNLSDMETGYKAFTGDVFQRLKLSEKGFGIEVEITARLARMRARIFEVPISYAGRTYAEGKKINWRDGIWALWCVLKYGLKLR